MSILDLFLKASLLVKGIIVILISFSVFSWAIIIKKIKILKSASRAVTVFEDRFWSGIELSRLYQQSDSRRDTLSGAEQIFYSGFKEFVRLHRTHHHVSDSALKGAARAMRISINREIQTLETHIPFLGTIGSISPYIGLLGTVWGIMHSFIALGVAKQATLQMVAPGIAEALIATAIGLFAAIPAAMAYNRFNQNINKIEQNYDNFMEEFIAILHRETVTSDTDKNAMINHNNQEETAKKMNI